MLASLVPTFNKDMSVAAYCLFAQKENLFTNPHLLGTGSYDGAGSIVGIEVLNNMTFQMLPDNCFVIVPVNNISIFADISAQFNGPKNKIMLLMDPSVKPDDSYLKRILELKKAGFFIGMKKLQVNQIEQYQDMLNNFDYLFIDCSYADGVKQVLYYKKYLSKIRFAAENVDTQEVFEKLVATGYFDFFEGDFYRIPINQQDTEVSPLKVNYLKLLSLINEGDFDLTKAADVISKDPALTISLLNIVNKLTVNSNIASIKQATAMLGQKELKRWLNTSVISNLCADKPNEITRISLIRGRFAEQLASEFSLSMKTEELFLMGIFSLLDYILNKDMKDALATVSVSKDISDALIQHEGDLAQVLDFILAYEAGNWQEVSRLIVLYNMEMDNIYKAYIDSLKWYKDMFM